MNFYIRKRRPPVISLVSLIDILAILLIFFIVTTTFKKEQPQVQIDLPESKTAEARPSENPPLLLRVTAQSKLLLGDEPVTLEEIPAALAEAQQSQPQRQLAMEADKEAPFGFIIQVLDALKEAGIENLPAFTKPQP